MYTCYIQSFKILASFCSWAGWFESDLVENLRRHVLAWCGSYISRWETFICFTMSNIINQQTPKKIWQHSRKACVLGSAHDTIVCQCHLGRHHWHNGAVGSTIVTTGSPDNLGRGKNNQRGKIMLLKMAITLISESMIINTKAFNSIQHDKLWNALTRKSKNGKILNIFQSMYRKLKACVNCTNCLMDYFDCTMGTRQGCVTSPIIFLLFINDLGNYLREKCRNCVLVSEEIEDLLALK